MKSSLAIIGLTAALLAVAYALPTPEQLSGTVESLDSVVQQAEDSLPLLRHRREEDKKNKINAYSQFRNGKHETTNLDYERKIYQDRDTKVSLYGGVEHTQGQRGVGGHTGLKVSF